MSPEYWRDFKSTKFAVHVTQHKPIFFEECEKNGILLFNLSERARLRDFYVCKLEYKDQFSDGRYELMSFDEWQVKPNGLFGKLGLPVVEY